LLALTADLGAVPEYRFHPVRLWRVDIAFPDHRVAVEIDGGIWNGGRHVRGAGVMGDCEKIAALAIAGWRFLRVTPQHVTSGVAHAWVRAAIQSKILDELQTSPRFEG